MVDNYGTRLKYALDSRGVSASDLAKKLQNKQRITKQAISKIARGDGKCFNAINHAQICLELNIDPFWLALGLRRDGQDNMEPLEETLPAGSAKIPDDILNAIRDQLNQNQPPSDDRAIREITNLLNNSSYETRLEVLGITKHLCSPPPTKAHKKSAA